MRCNTLCCFSLLLLMVIFQYVSSSTSGFISSSSEKSLIPYDPLDVTSWTGIQERGDSFTLLTEVLIYLKLSISRIQGITFYLTFLEMTMWLNELKKYMKEIANLLLRRSFFKRYVSNDFETSSSSFNTSLKKYQRDLLLPWGNPYEISHAMILTRNAATKFAFADWEYRGPERFFNIDYDGRKFFFISDENRWEKLIESDLNILARKYVLKQVYDAVEQRKGVKIYSFKQFKTLYPDIVTKYGLQSDATKKFKLTAKLFFDIPSLTL